MSFAVSFFCFFRLFVRDSFSRTANFPFQAFGEVPLFGEIPAFQRLFSGIRISVVSIYAAILYVALHPGRLSRGQSARFVSPPFLHGKKGGRCFPVYYISTAEKSQPFSPSRPRKTPFSRFFESFPSFLIFPGLFPFSPPAGFIRFQAFPRPFFRFFQASPTFRPAGRLFSPVFPTHSPPVSPAPQTSPTSGKQKRSAPVKALFTAAPDIRLSSDFFREMCAQRPFGAPSALYSP